MPKQKIFIKSFNGLHYDIDPFDIGNIDSPLLNDCYADPVDGLSSPNGSTKFENLAKADTIYGLFDYTSRRGHYIIISIGDGSIESTAL